MKRFVMINLAAMFTVISALFLAAGPVHSQTTAKSEPTTVPAKADAVDFKRDIQPIFRRNCYRCHGPKKARGRLKLTSRKAALGKRDADDSLFVPGHPEKSYLMKRLTNELYGDVMPQDSESLSKNEIALIRRWIKTGAEWPEDIDDDIHWAYVKPERPSLPKVKNTTWPKNPIDYFVLATLEHEGLTPSEPAERARLIRRVSLALTGLPPSLKDVDDFIADKSPDAYEKVVDRLLQSKHYGERWAQHWLDLARYADSNGFQADQLRDSWAYRDWVIKAFNNGMRFDQFVIEQLAGDLLPNATLEQKIATGFHRTPTCNVEAGVHPEANRVNQVFDRVNTTGMVFLGATMECAQCHDHKYDPFTQEDYYRLYAYFNNTPLEVKKTSGVTFDFVGPEMKLPLPPTEKAKRTELLDKLEKIQAQQKQIRKAQSADFADWLKEATKAVRTNPAIWKDLPITRFESNGGEDFEFLKDGSVLVTGSLPGTALYTLPFEGPLSNVIGFKIEALTHEKLPGSGPGRGDAQRTNFILSEFTVEIDRGKKGNEDIELHDAQADFSQQRWPVANAIDGDRKTGWAIAPQFRKSHWATFRTQKPISLSGGETLVVKLDQNYGRGRTIGRVRISVLTGDELAAGLPAEVTKILAKNGKRTKKETKILRAAYSQSNPKLQQLDRMAKQVNRQLKQLKPPTTLVMVEMDKPRKTHILNRGNYLDPGQPVSPGTPEILHSLDPKYPKNRLGFAKWLMSKDNPLVARVAVNRWWARLFGRGIVSTLEDFGTQAEYPTHPQLLDWLAVEFMERGWSVKHMHKLMVMSATFRQSARITPELKKRDPNNLLYARGPRFRLTAEVIRDNALTVAGLLSKKMYGEPIMPYQPGGIWKAVGRNQPKWVTATDEDRFRRGLYVVWKRAAPYPSFVTFDAPDRAACTVERPRTNTPLQALTLLNDPAYAEMALALAQRMMTESESKTLASRATYGFRLCVAREPSQRELQILVRLFTDEHQKLKDNPGLAKQRIQNLLPRLRNPKLDEAELAAWFSVANVLLNLDETISQ